MSVIADIASLLYTVDEAAELCEVARTTIYEHMRLGLLPYETIAGRRLMHEDDLRVYMTALDQRRDEFKKQRAKRMKEIRHGG